MKENLIFHLRHGTAEPITTAVGGDLLTRLRPLQSTRAIQEILGSLPEEKIPYGQAMLGTMRHDDSVIEVADIKAEGVVTIDRRRAQSLDDLLTELSGQRDSNVGTLEEIEIGVARLEKGGVSEDASPLNR